MFFVDQHPGAVNITRDGVTMGWTSDAMLGLELLLESIYPSV
jgi:hypothetical protein